MVNKPGKPKSKRTPVRLRHRIEKVSAAKQRKQRKQAKKNPEWRSRLKKDPGIPNLFPYKDKILHEIEEKRRMKEEEAARKWEEARSKRDEQNDVEVDMQTEDQDEAEDDALSDLIDDEEGGEDDEENTNPMSALLASARARAADFEGLGADQDMDAMDEYQAEDNDEPAPMDFSNLSGSYALENSRRAYDKIFKSVLSSSDVLLYVLDARDPNGTRSQEVEREIAAADGGSKRLILILNKIDLIPPPVLKAWLTYLQRYFPTIPLRASTPAPNAKTFDHKSMTVRGTSETLFKALKSYAHSKQVKRSITVGVLGYPNVGKSSVINALSSRLNPRPFSKTSTSCPVGAEAGVSTSLREVKLDGKLKILDSPGIVFPSSSSSTSHHLDKDSPPANLTPKQLHAAHLTLLSALPPSSITDPLPAITLLLHRLSRSSMTPSPLLEYYGLSSSTLVPSGENGDITTDFLLHVARKRGRLGKGGVPNLQSAAMGVLGDWRDGRIKGWVDPPASLPVPSASRGGGDVEEEEARAKVVTQWAEEFKIEGLWGRTTMLAGRRADECRELGTNRCRYEEMRPDISHAA